MGILFGVMIGATASWAQPVTCDAKEVLVLIAARTIESETLESSLRELLGRVGWTLLPRSVEAIPSKEDAVSKTHGYGNSCIVAWADLRSGGNAKLLMVDSRDDRLVSSRELVPQSRDILIEEVAHIIQASVEDITVQRAQRTPLRPSTESGAVGRSLNATGSTRNTESRWGLDAAGFAVTRYFGTGAEFNIGVGATIGFAFRRDSFRPTLWMAAEYQAPFDVHGSYVDINIRTAMVRLNPTMKLIGSDLWMLEMGPQVAYERLWYEAHSSIAIERHFETESSHATVLVGAVAMLRFSLAQSADLFVAATVDVDLVPWRFSSVEESAEKTYFQVSALRPSLVVGFTFNLAGDPIYPKAQSAL